MGTGYRGEQTGYRGVLTGKVGKGGVRVQLMHCAVCVLPVDQRGSVVGVFHRGIIPDGTGVAVQISLQRAQIVAGSADVQLRQQLSHRDHALRRGGGAGRDAGVGVRVHHAGQIYAGAADLQRVGGQRGFFHVADIAAHTVGKGKDQRNADDTDGTGKGGEQGACLFGEQIVEAEGKGGEQGHGGVPHVPVHGGNGSSLVLGFVGHGIGADHAVL